MCYDTNKFQPCKLVSISERDEGFFTGAEPVSMAEVSSKNGGGGGG